jgi:hypothetical protein
MFDDRKESEPAQQTSDADLAEEIVRSIPRNAREQVTCRRVNQNYYRCNWWSQQDPQAYDNPGMTGLLVTTSRISRSQFLHVTKGGDGLNIRVIASDKPQL